MRFTTKSVAAVTVPPGKGYALVWDEGLPGFGLRASEGGSRMWVVQYRAAGKTKRETIGRVDAISLDEARKRAKETLARVQLGSDPHAEKKEARARAAVTFESVAKRYLVLAQERLKPRSYEEVDRHLTKHWAPLNASPIHKINRATIAGRLGEISGENGPFAANRARASVSALFSWALGEGLTEVNPVIGTNKPTEEVARDHVISDPELTAIWQACRDDDYGRIVRLLILTAQRRDEVGALAWNELSLDGEAPLWTIPKERTKNGIPHDVPLSPLSVEILRSAPKRDNRGLVFGDGAGGFQGWSKAKAALDGRIKEAGHKVRPWRLHDLRRTAATRMADLGTLPHVVEAILNHVSGHKAGVAGIYNRAAYASEKREALARWAGQVSKLVEGGYKMTAELHELSNTVRQLEDELRAAWEGLPESFGDDIVHEREAMALALLAVSRFLSKTDLPPTYRTRFVQLSTYLADLNLGTRSSLFRVERHGRTLDPTMIWIGRANICLALEVLTVAGANRKDACRHLASQYKSLASLATKKSRSLYETILEWDRQFRSGSVKHPVASLEYSDNLEKYRRLANEAVLDGRDAHLVETVQSLVRIAIRNLPPS